MKCEQCGTENAEEAVFCAECGAKLKEETAVQSEMTETVITEVEHVERAGNSEVEKTEVATAEVGAGPATVSASVVEEKKAGVGIIQFMVQAVVKPVSTFKEKLSEYAGFKQAGIVTAISAGLALILSLISVIFSTVYRRTCSAFSGKCSSKFDWDNLEDLEFGKLLIGMIVGYAVLYFGVAAVLFGVSKVMKAKETNYCRFLTVVAVGFIPAVVCGFLAPITGLIGAGVAAFLYLMGGFYTLVMLYEGATIESGFKGDKKVYFSVITMAILMIVLMLVLWMFAGSLSSSLELDLF